FREDHSRRAVRRVDCQHIEVPLIAAEALDVQNSSVLRPIDAGDVDVAAVAKLYAPAGECRHVLDAKLDSRVVASGTRITLVHDGSAGGLELGPLDDMDIALIHQAECDARVVGAPPVTGRATELLLRDEFGSAPASELGATLRQGALSAACRRHDVQIVISDERDVAPLRRHLGIDITGGG